MIPSLDPDGRLSGSGWLSLAIMTTLSSASASSTLILYEFGDFHSLPAEVALDHFKQHVRQLWSNRKWFYEVPDEEAETEVSALIQRNGQAILQFDGREIRARNYVGFFRYGHLTIYILPKIFRGTSFTPSLIQQHLHFYLSYSKRAYFPFQWAPVDMPPSDYFLQWLVLPFARHAAWIVSGQPFYTYESVTEKDAFVRGRLAVQDYIREQVSTGQWQHLHYEHTPYQYDNRFNQIIRHVATLLLPFAEQESLEKLQTVLFTLDEVSIISCTVDDCDQVPINQLTEGQSRLVAMCRWFLGATARDEAGLFTPNLSFLVPMERVFEDFMVGFIQRHFPAWQAASQHTAYLSQSAGSPVGLIRNDLWLPRTNTIIDAKYKLLSSPIPSRIPAEDLYQMLSYAVARKAFHVHLVYPALAKEFTNSSNLAIPVFSDSFTVTIHIHRLAITLSVVGRSLQDAFSELTQRLQEKLQKALTFEGV